MMVRLRGAGLLTTAVRLGVLLVAVASLGAARPAAAAEPYAYLPTASVTDGRFLTVAGAGLQTVAGHEILVKIAFSRDAAGVSEIGIFDGDTSGADQFYGPPTGRWDFGYARARFEIYADPDADGVGVGAPIASWTSDTMLDNAWSNLPVPRVPEAQAESGHYFYVLHVQLGDPTVTAANSFKMRTNGSLSLKDGSLGFMAPLWSDLDAHVIYPGNWDPDLNGDYDIWDMMSWAGIPTAYDGSWNFFLDVPSEISYLDVWDGDLDYGTTDVYVFEKDPVTGEDVLVYERDPVTGEVLFDELGQPIPKVLDPAKMDTDDLDTPNEVPSWATSTAAAAEGIADGYGYKATGDPEDDYPADIFSRPPSVQYEVIAPTGQIFPNFNPSGNVEWEQFRIDTEPFNPLLMDYHADRLPAGIYEIRMDGMDVSNLNAWRFFYPMLGVNEDGEPVAPLRPNAVGIWQDQDGDGRKPAAGEPSLPGIILQLVDANGNVVATTVTDSNGLYQFTPPVPGTYTVRIADANFLPGGPLERAWPTYGGFAQSVTIAGTATLTIDFGYYVPPLRPSLPSDDFGTIGFWKNWNNHFGSDFVDSLLRVIQYNSGVFGPNERFLEVNSSNLSDFLNTDKKPQQDKAAAQLLVAWLNALNGSMPMNYVVSLSGSEGSLYGAKLWRTRNFLYRSEQLIADARNASTLTNLLSRVNQTRRLLLF
jgi:hypothetical protein